MSVVSLKKGLDLPIEGNPSQIISVGVRPRTVAVLGECYRGLKPSFLVKEGDQVRKGQAVFQDRHSTSIKYVAPSSGRIVSIERGEKRVFKSIIIELNETNDPLSQEKIPSGKIRDLTRKEVVSKMLSGGLWPILIQRPFGIVADPKVVPHSIFVNAMDTNPLALNPELVVSKNISDFKDGLAVIARLTEGKIHLCKSPRSQIPHGESGRVINHWFEGPHPTGLVGTHIHFIDPINRMDKIIWSIGYQDVIALGKFFTSGVYYSDRYVALAGPQVKNPRIIKTTLGANLFDLTKDELLEGENRIISGSILNGTKADEQVGFLGPYDNIVSVLREDRERVFHGFMSPGFNKFSVKRIFTSAFDRTKKFRFGTSSEGSHRDVVPIGSYEQVMPLDIIATFLVRSLLSNDLELAEKIGALELIGEDVGLLTYVCPGKNDIGACLTKVLDQIRKENQ